MWPHCSLSAVQRQTNSKPFPDLILVFYVEGEIDWDCGFALESLPAKTGICTLLRLSVFSVVAQATPQDSCKASQGYFRLKDVDRRIEAIAQVNVESKEEKVERAEFNVPTCGHIAVCQRCRDKQIQSLFPTSSLFSTLKVRLIEIAGLPWKACPPKQAYVYSLDISVFLWLRKQWPKIRATPVQGYFRMKDVDRRIEAIAQVNIESKEEKVERAEFNVPTCGHIAVCQRCRDRQIQSLFPTSSLFSTLKVRLIEIAGLPWKACPPKQEYVYTP